MTRCHSTLILHSAPLIVRNGSKRACCRGSSSIPNRRRLHLSLTGSTIGSCPGNCPTRHYPDDWFVLVSAQTNAPYPDDWIYPDNRNAPSTAAPSTAPPAPSPQLSSANPAISNRPPPPPDPFAAYWSRIPASRLTALAWAPPVFPSSNPFSPQNMPPSAPLGLTPPPIFPNSFGQFPSPGPSPSSVAPSAAANGMLGGIAKMSAARAAANDPWHPDANSLVGGMAKLLAASAPAEVAAQSLFGSLARLQPPDTGAHTSMLGSRSEAASDPSNRPSSPVHNLANVPWPLGSIGSNGFGSNSLSGNNMSGQFPLSGRASFDASRDLLPPAANPQPANAAASPLLESTGSTSGNGDQPAPRSSLKSSAAFDSMALPCTLEHVPAW